MSDKTLYPNGRGWQCMDCGADYPEDYEPDACENCGANLVRIMLAIKLDLGT